MERGGRREGRWGWRGEGGGGKLGMEKESRCETQKEWRVLSECVRKGRVKERRNGLARCSHFELSQNVNGRERGRVVGNSHLGMPF